MLTRTKAFLAGLAIAIAAGAIAQQSGGFPSSPSFQKVFGPQATRNVTYAPGLIVNNSGGTLWLNTTGTISILSQGMHWNGSNWICDITGAVGNVQIVTGAAGYNNGTCASVGATAVLSGTNIGPAPIVCTTACSVTGMLVGQTATVAKVAAGTSRNTTTTLTADPDLQFTNVPTGAYRVWLSADYNTGAGGFRDAIAGGFSFSIAGVTNCAGVAISAVMFQGAMLNTCASTSGGGDEFTGTMSVSGPTTVSLNWAQNSSNAANSTLQNVGTSMTIQRIN